MALKMAPSFFVNPLALEALRRFKIFYDNTLPRNDVENDMYAKFG